MKKYVSFYLLVRKENNVFILSLIYNRRKEEKKTECNSFIRPFYAEYTKLIFCFLRIPVLLLLYRMRKRNVCGHTISDLGVFFMTNNQLS